MVVNARAVSSNAATRRETAKTESRVPEDRVLANQREPKTSRRPRRSHGALSGRRKPWTVMRYRLMMPPKRRWTIV